ncbi:hypothetical protein GCM10010464_16650 [Pseudonocardia yunnanensis]|uniref:Anti-sigma-M factor RsmA n=1 Tax=Pseudonocardia yunnanensis TaxID=58107 RepID=A0ABW4EVU9_9PSEU
MTTPRPDLAQLADLDAGVLEPTQAAQVRAAAAAHPESAAVLHALAVTRGELAELPAPPVPPEFAARWAAALEAEAATDEPSPDVEVGPPRSSLDRRRPAPRRPWPPRAARRTTATRSSWRRPLAAVGAAALLSVLVLAGVLSSRPTPAPSIDRVNLAAVARSAIGSVDAGALADPARRAGCLRAAAPALAPDAPLVGGRQVTVGGRQAVLLVLVTGRLGSFDVVVVDSECGPGHGMLLKSIVIGG